MGMYRFVLVILTVSIFFCCKKEADTADYTEESFKYEFYSASKVDTLTTPVGLYFRVKPGNDLVFLYTHTGPSCKSIWDEEYTNQLVFRVPSSVNSFYYENRQLEDAMCFFNNSHLFGTGAVPVSTGFVSGTKRSDGKWNLEIDVDIGPSRGRLIINKTFVQH